MSRSRTFRNLPDNFKYPAINPNIVLAGAASKDTSGVPEWDIDSQTILGTAGGTLGTLTFYVASSFSDADLTTAYNAAVTAHVATTVNVSLGVSEATANSDGSMAADDAIFALAIAQGQTFSAASGDTGSNSCYTPPNNTGPNICYPASSPYVISVGGTTLTETNGAYGSETAWSLGGGGPSKYEPQPSWQVGKVNGATRDVPDLAFDADPNTGIVIVLGGLPSGPWGGTSLASPTFVGLQSRFQSMAANTKLFPAPWIYNFPLNRRSMAFHDITTGSNGYAAGVGWDFATGWGSLNAAGVPPGLATVPLPAVVTYLLNNQLLNRR